MRVLYIFRSIALWGGIERILVDKMNYLADRCGYDVYLLTCDQGNHPFTFRLSERVKHEDLNICFYRQYEYHGLRRLLIACRMAYEYKKLMADKLCIIEPDIIVTTTSDRLNTITKLKGSIPLVVESHSICRRTINFGRCWLFRKIHRYSLLKGLKKADVIVALTEGDAAEWSLYHPNVIVIPNFVHKHKERVSALTSKNVIFVGRFDYQKRAQDAINIWKMVQEQHPDYILHMYGDGDMQNDVTLLASSIGGIVVHQPIYDIFKVYQECSILISTSLFEPFGLVIPEAMSCGLPVVAFDCNYGPSEFIVDGENGYLIKDYDARIFANKVCDLIDDITLRKRLGKSAYLSSVKYNQETVMPMWIHLFNSFIDKHY